MRTPATETAVAEVAGDMLWSSVAVRRLSDEVWCSVDRDQILEGEEIEIRK
jgi:hypothetical protein